MGGSEVRPGHPQGTLAVVVEVLSSRAGDGHARPCPPPLWVATVPPQDAPSAAMAHPPDSPGEHLVPLLFCYGAAGQDRGAGACVHKEYLGSLPMAAYEFGRKPAIPSAI